MPKPITEEGLSMDAAYVINGTSVSNLLQFICPGSPSLDVLEAGSGSGKLSFDYFLRGANVTLVELDPEAIAYSKALFERIVYWNGDRNNREVGRKSPTATCRWLEQSLFDLSVFYPKPIFDLVFSEGTTHHWPPSDPRRAESVQQMAAVCKPGGTVVVIGSNAHCPEMMEYAEKIDHTYRGMPPKQTPLLMNELAFLMAQAGIREVTIEPVDGSLTESKLIAGWGKKS